MTKLIIWNRTFSRENYSVTTCNNGRDAIDIFENDNFDIVFGREHARHERTRNAVWNERKKSAIPMIMITKSEEEYIMEEAIDLRLPIT
jgi:CheY-like chemotaxis protein